MVLNNLTEKTKNTEKELEKYIESYFEDKAISEMTTISDDQDTITADYIIYRSFDIKFIVADLTRTNGSFDILISNSLDLDSVSEEELPFSSFDEKTVNDTLKLLDKYLQWRMTDNQKRTFGLL